MELNPNKTTVETFKDHLKKLSLEIHILMLPIHGIMIFGKNLLTLRFWRKKGSIKSIYPER